MAEASSLMRPTTSKGRPPTLRNSCNACADAKVGCTKEKPACVRCVRRGETCTYAITRRPGRRAREKQPNPEATTATQSQSPGANRNSDSFLPQDVGTASSLLASSLSPHATGSVTDEATFGENFFNEYGDLSDALLSGDLTSPMSTDSTLQVDFDDFLASLSPNSVFGPQILDTSLPPNIDPAIDPDLSSIFPGEFSPRSTGKIAEPLKGWSGGPKTKPASLTPASESSAYSASPTNWFPSNSHVNTGRCAQVPGRSTQTNESESPPLLVKSTGSCGCFGRGLYLLGQLAPPPSPDKAEQSNLRLEFEEVIARNDTAVEKAWDILQCPVPHDESLLLLISLLVFKILGWYAASVCSLPADGEESDNMADDPTERVVLAPAKKISGYEYRGEKADRIVCQLILSKIHSVWRIVNALSQQLSVADKRRGSAGRGGRTASAVQELLFGGPVFSHLTASNMAQDLKKNLRSRLQDLSQCIVERLSR